MVAPPLIFAGSVSIKEPSRAIRARTLSQSQSHRPVQTTLLCASQRGQHTLSFHSRHLVAWLNESAPSIIGQLASRRVDANSVTVTVRLMRASRAARNSTIATNGRASSLALGWWLCLRGQSDRGTCKSRLDRTV